MAHNGLDNKSQTKFESEGLEILFLDIFQVNYKQRARYLNIWFLNLYNILNNLLRKA